MAVDVWIEIDRQQFVIGVCPLQCGDQIRKLTMLAVVTAIALILATIGYVSLLTRISYDCRRDSFDYVNVWVEAPADVQYEIYLPIPVEAPNQTWYLVDFLNVTKGNPTWSTVLTPYGVALRIVGKGNISLRAAASTSKYSYAGFSPANKTDIGPGHIYSEYLVYVNASELETGLSFYVGAGTSTPEGNPKTTVVQALEGSLETGWQEVTGHTSILVC